MLNRLKSLGQMARQAATRLAAHPQASPSLFGLAAGIAGWSAVHPFVATFGFNRETVAALLLASSISFAFGVRYAGRLRRLERHALPSLLASGWLVLLPLMLAGARFVVAAAPLSWLVVPPARVPLLLAAAVVVLGVPAFCLGLLAARRTRRGEDAVLMLATGGGVAANALLLAPILGLQWPLLAVTVGTAAAWFYDVARGKSENVAAEPLGASSSFASLQQICSVAMTGVACGLCGRILAQLTLEAGYLLAAGATAFFIGAGTGMALAARLRHRLGNDFDVRRLGAILIAVVVLMPLATFSWWIERHLDANAYVSSVFWLMAIRAGTVATLLIPIGLGCGLVAAPAGSRVGILLCAAAAGVAVSGWLIPAVGVTVLALAVAVSLLAVNAPPFPTAIPRTGRRWGVAAACAAALIAIGANVGRYEPAKAARLLFSTEAFIAHQRGVPTELLLHLDDTRLATATERPGGTVTIWKQGGDSFVVRSNGISIAATSVRPDRCPLPTADVLRVVMPLVLHDAPESVLLLGDPVGVATDTAANFPLRRIVCYEPDSEIRDATVPRAVATDARISRSSLEPRLAVSAEDRKFDVVVSDPGMPSLPDAAANFTREFYTEIAARLNPEGLLCQRIRYADLGPEPLRVLAATAQGIFGEALIVEVGSGEYVLLATPPGAVLVRDGLVTRLQKPHVRRTLAALGWDWCVPLNLATVEQPGLTELADEAAARNTVFNGHLAYTLPQEVMRWGMKSQELQQATAGMTSHLLARAVSDADQRDVLDRIAEVTGQRRLMTEYPDQPWAYRKEVRTRMKETPRSVIQPVAGEVQRVMHPDDQRRLDYFGALGDAVKAPGVETLRKLEEFATPYDPLVTYFLHHEAAPLYGRLGRAGNRAELEHRLYAAHFADLRDRSVRNEIAALELLAANPDLIPDATERFDQFNALIEVLLGRWEVRGTAQPRSPATVMVDIDKTLDAMDAVLAVMDPLAAEAGLSDDDWRLRKAAIERTLTRPLRSYRTTLLPHLRKAQREAAAKTADNK